MRINNFFERSLNQLHQTLPHLKIFIKDNRVYMTSTLNTHTQTQEEKNPVLNAETC